MLLLLVSNAPLIAFGDLMKSDVIRLHVFEISAAASQPQVKTVAVLTLTLFKSCSKLLDPEESDEIPPRERHVMICLDLIVFPNEVHVHQSINAAARAMQRLCE